jgi:hypothetical protein
MMNGRPLRVVVCVVAILLMTSMTCRRSLAQQEGKSNSADNPLVRVLHAKGILSDEDMAQISQAYSPADAEQRLAKLLLTKGVISQADYDQTLAASEVVNVASTGATGAHAMPAVYRVPVNAGPAVEPAATGAPVPAPAQTASAAPAVVPALTPIRAFPVGGIKKGELKPAFSIAGVGITPYGFIKTTFVHDSSSAGGDDFPLPGFLTDTGPNSAPEFHVKTRATRFGSNFEWLDPSGNLTLTGKIELDFEGNFNRSDNRNIGSIRSYNPGIRLAYARLDYKVGEKDTFSALFGQDWTPFTSSTLPSILETTGTGIGFGLLWERAPQIRVGWTHNFGGFQLMPEIAMVLPAFGNVPANVQSATGTLTVTGVANQLGYGERQGADSARPQVEGRIVGQWQLDHAPGVAPAQLIFSFEQGQRTAIVLGASVPAAFKPAFATGARVSSDTDGWTGEFQLPTRFATLIGKYYSGSDLRYYFGGQLFSNFNDSFGLTGTATAPSIDGASTVVFGRDATGAAVVAPQRPVRSRGGFAQLGLPLSRIAGADPQGRNAGWSVYFLYGIDQAKTRDLLRVAPGGSRAKSDMMVGTLNYKLNKWVTFSFEQSLYRTRANPEAPFPLFNGVPSREAKDIRSEGGTIITF